MAPLVPAPVPRCSPFIFINKLAEWSNVWSDSNPYFPVPPCEYGGPMEALAKGDLEAVFVTAQPLKISLHNFYEFVWLLKTGIPRMLRILAGNEAFISDSRILQEGYQHYSSNARTTQIGHNTPRRPEIIDNFKTFKGIVLDKIEKLAREGPDKHSTAFTPLGNLPSRMIQFPENRIAETEQETLPSDHYLYPHIQKHLQNPYNQNIYKKHFDLTAVPSNNYKSNFKSVPSSLRHRFRHYSNT